MSAIAGYADNGGHLRAELACKLILSSLGRFGGDGNAYRSLGDVCFGRALHHVVPEDDYDAQPLIGGGGKRLMVADVRIDNRVEIAARLGLDVRRAAELSDSDLLSLAWDRWQLGAVDHLLGDFAFAVWERDDQRLTLVRSPLAMKTLFFYRSARFTAFATLPHAIFGIPALPKSFDRDVAAVLVGPDPFAVDGTLFAGVRRVKQGHAVVLSPSGERQIRVWDLKNQPAPATLAAAGEGLREELERAVSAQMRRRSGPLSLQLSSGRDSGAVAAIAARLSPASDGFLFAITGAPRLGFADGTDREWLSDESEMAAATAAMCGNIVHRVCRPDGFPIEQLFDTAHRDNYVPILNASNANWALQTVREAAALGSRVLLTANQGNFSVSRGGTDALVDVRRTAGLPSWWRLARSLHATSNVPWRTIGNLSFGSLLPRTAHAWLTRALGRDFGVTFDLPYLRDSFRTQAEAIGRATFDDVRPRGRYRDGVRDFLYRMETGVTIGIPGYGVDLRDPTSDRRLIQYCDSLSPAQLISADTPRPTYAAAFADRVPDAVIEGKRRGFQGADWFETYPAAELRAAFARYSANSIVDELIDVGQINRMLDCWPTSGGYRMDHIIIYNQRLLNTLALASFINVHFPS
ncbi:MAG: asparagine synthetase B family protein [Sphingomicrobium sp.]